MNTEQHSRMLALVKEWKGSGIPLITFSKSIGISKSKFEYWVRKDREAELAIQNPGFIEISNINKSEQQPHIVHPTTVPKVEIAFPSGLCLKIYN